MSNNQPEVKRFPAPLDGAVLVTSMPKVTEREIFDDRNAIIAFLHSAYTQLNDDMAEFQSHWDASPARAFFDASREGVAQGSASWLADQKEFFDTKTWSELASTLQTATDTSIDRLATYSKRVYNQLERKINRHLEHPADTLGNYAWWRATVHSSASEFVDEKGRQIDEIANRVRLEADSIISSASVAAKIFKHRASIMNLPNLISTGRPDLVQKFVENELMDIDPKLAKEIRLSPRFAIVLELIADHDSALSYVSYTGLMLESVPPNFYAYVAGKGAAYLAIEVVLLIFTAIFTAGVTTVARLSALAARFALVSSKTITSGKKLRRAKIAIDSFVARLYDLVRVVDEFKMLGTKLVKARTQNLVVRGNTRTTLKAKKESIRRDQRCRVCQSIKHATPRIKLGEIVYK